MNRREAIKTSALLAAAPGLAQQRGWKPVILGDRQNATVIVLTGLIIPATDTPGARAANVNRYIDLFLAAGPEKQRSEFLDGIKWLDEYSNKQYGGDFIKLKPGEQTEILTALEKGGEGLDAGRQFFRAAKALTGRIYYASEIGFRELNKGGRVPKSFACTDPAHHAE